VLKRAEVKHQLAELQSFDRALSVLDREQDVARDLLNLVGAIAQTVEMPLT